MSKNGVRSIKVCIGIWLLTSIVVITGSLDANTITISGAIKTECGLTIALVIVIIALVILDRGGESTDRPKLSNVDKAKNCLTTYSFDGHKDIDLLNDALRYIMREKAEHKAKEKEAHRLAERKASK